AHPATPTCSGSGNAGSSRPAATSSWPPRPASTPWGPSLSRCPPETRSASTGLASCPKVSAASSRSSWVPIRRRSTASRSPRRRATSVRPATRPCSGSAPGSSSPPTGERCGRARSYSDETVRRLSLLSPGRSESVRPAIDLPGRIPPHNLDAERAVLGACLLDRAILERAAAKLEPEDFYTEAHRTIYRRMLALHEAQ